MSQDLIFSFRFAGIAIILVFSALAIISTAIYYASKLDKYFSGRKKTSEQDEGQAAGQTSNIDNLTLVLISAAAATMIQGRFHIKKVRRLMPGDHVNSPWATRGLAILHGSHVIEKK